MNYLTNYYKNLSEQLQEKVNQLEKLLEAYPGGMTPGRQKVLNKADISAIKSGEHPYKGETSTRVREIRARAVAADERGYNREIDAPVVNLAKTKGPQAAHDAIVDEIITHHVTRFPHMTPKGERVPNVKASEEHVRGILNKHPQAPFQSVSAAVEAMAPHAIEANPSLEMAGYEDAMERSMGGDPSEMSWYEDHVMENEGEHKADLIHTIGQALKQKHG
jgi:hypothetical protein